MGKDAGGGDVSFAQGLLRRGADQASELGNASQALREPGIELLKKTLRTGEIPDQFLTGPMQAQEQQLTQAKTGILNSGVRGGQLTRSLSELPIRRLAGRDQLRSQFANNALGMSLQYGFGGASPAIQGLTSLATGSGNLGMQLGGQEDSRAGAIGSGAGMAIGMAMAMY